MLRFQWNLLVEAGWQPDLTEPAEGDGTVAFDPVEGRMVRDSGDAGLWRVRRGTLQALQDVAGGGIATCDDESVQRANKLLAAHLRNVLGEEPATMGWTFGRLPAGGTTPSRRRTG